MIYNIIVSLASAFLFVHNTNTIKEDYNTPFNDCKVWGFEDGSWASKARWGSNLGLDSIGAASSGLLFVDSVSGGNLRTKAVREFLGGFESSSDLKDKCSKVEEEILGKKVSTAKQPELIAIDSLGQSAHTDSDIESYVVENVSSSVQEQASDISENCASEQVSDKDNQYDCSLEELPVNDSSDNSLDSSSDNSSDNSSDDFSNEIDSCESESGIPAPVAV